jgi:hypothetical protein
MTKNKTCIDLFSGLGGWSRAFKDRGWDVITIDNDPSFNPTICIDIMDFDPKILTTHPTVILASPPCQKFSSNTITLNWSKRTIKNNGVVLAIGLVAKTLDIIYKLQPDYWVIENPQGMLRKVMGKPKVVTYFRSWGTDNLKPTDLWGIMPDIEWPKPEPGWLPDGTRQICDPAISAMIPYNLSLAICDGIEKELEGMLDGIVNK